MKNPNQIISQNIAQLRKRKRLSQEQLANQLGISYQAVSKWENNQSCPDIALLPELADIFGVSTDELFGRSEQHINLLNGLVGAYFFDGNAKDSSGNGHHGHLVGGEFCPDRFGQERSALMLDGNDDYMVVDPPPHISAEGFSVSVWCLYDSQTSFEGWHSAIISQDGHSKRRVFQLSTKDEYITFHRFLHDPDLSPLVHTYPEYWYHIVATYEKEQYRLYINGELVNENNGQFRPDDTEPFYIGRKSTSEDSFFFHGKIDDVRLYNRPLNQAEINALFAENGWRPVPIPESSSANQQTSAQPPILKRLDSSRMTIVKSIAHDAATWYVEHLGFNLLETFDDAILLSLPKGPGLVLECADEPSAIGSTHDPSKQAVAIYQTERHVDDLCSYLTNAGASGVQIVDEGFAFFIHFTDPFGQQWILMNEKRGV